MITILTVAISILFILVGYMIYLYMKIYNDLDTINKVQNLMYDAIRINRKKVTDIESIISLHPDEKDDNEPTFN